MSKHLPLVAWSRQEIMSGIWEHEAALNSLTAELDRRGDRDEKRYGFPVPIQDRPGVIGAAYRHFATAGEAFDAARKAFSDDPETAPYKVHPVYLGKGD